MLSAQVEARHPKLYFQIRAYGDHIPIELSYT